MISVEVRKGNVETALQIFKEKVRKAYILENYKERQFYTKPSAKKRIARKKAIRLAKYAK